MNFKYSAVALATMMAVSTGAMAEKVWSQGPIPDGALTQQVDVKGADLQYYYAALEVIKAAEGTLNNVDIKVNAKGPKYSNGGQDQPVLVLKHSDLWQVVDGKWTKPEKYRVKGNLDFAGDTLNLALDTDLVGGGNNAATALQIAGRDAHDKISAKNATISVKSTNPDGKAVYGIGFNDGVLELTGDTVTVNIESATDRSKRNGGKEVPDDINYSEAIGVNVSGGEFISSENTTITINGKTTAETPSKEGLEESNATPFTGFNVETEGSAHVKGLLKVNAESVAGNATGIGVSNHFYNSSLGDNYGQASAEFNDLDIAVKSQKGTVAGIAIEHVKNDDGKEVQAVKVNGQSNIDVTSDEGKAYGIKVDTSSMEFDGNVQAAAKSNTDGNAYSLYAANGAKVSFAGAQNHLTGDAFIGKNSAFMLGQVPAQAKAAPSEVKLTLDGKLITEEDSTLTLNNATIDLAKDATIDAKGEVKADKATIAVNDIADGEDKQVNIANLADKSDLTVATTAEVTDKYASAQESAEALQKTVAVEGDGAKDVKFTGEEGAVNGAWAAEVNEDGKLVVNEAKNTKLDALNSLNVLSALTWRHEMNDLTKRMGEIRDLDGETGLWVRAYGSKLKYGDQNLSMKNSSIQLGADTDVAYGWKLGGAFNYTSGDTDYDFGDADTKVYGLGVYGTWLRDNGQFLDVIAKWNRIENDFKFNGMNGDYNSNAYSLSAEYGWHFDLNQKAFIEPQAELTYGHINGQDFEASNGVKVSQDGFNALIGRLGVRTGFKLPNDKGNVYLRASALHDFKGDMDATVSNGTATKTMSDELGGTWYEYAIGANYKFTDHTYTYVDVERTGHGDVKEDWRWNIGLRYAF